MDDFFMEFWSEVFFFLQERKLYKRYIICHATHPHSHLYNMMCSYLESSKPLQVSCPLTFSWSSSLREQYKLRQGPSFRVSEKRSKQYTLKRTQVVDFVPASSVRMMCRSIALYLKSLRCAWACVKAYQRIRM